MSNNQTVKTTTTVRKTTSTMTTKTYNENGVVGKKDKVLDKWSFEHLFGFRLDELYTMDSFTKLVNRPTDPAGWCVTRALFGLLMFLDVLQERGLSNADSRFGDEMKCGFPFFDFMPRPTLTVAILLYTCMLIGIFMVMIGYKMRYGAVMYSLPYWFFFISDKSRWNNHSYMFGLFSLIILVSDGNRYWSVDGVLDPRKRHCHIPLWNYILPRFQIFIVYFIAGVKKLTYDWRMGWSMQKLSGHWAFAPFHMVFPEQFVDHFIVHGIGLILDLFIVYFLFFDFTRPYALPFVLSFHLMNSQIFSIGMFPWTMLLTTPLYFHPDWPRRLCKRLPSWLDFMKPLDIPLQANEHCIYPKEEVKPEEKEEKLERPDLPAEYKKPVKNSKPSRYHKVFAWVVIGYVFHQLFLPYSHFITNGYNNWTDGLYGYTWTMMVHTWNVQHMKITYKMKDTGEIGYLKPNVWVGGNSRWASHADMAKQYGRCIERNLKKFNISNIEIYFDVWKSMNKRFQQRMFDPNIDILTAPWNPLFNTPWVKPLLIDLSDWRSHLQSMKKGMLNGTNHTDIVFVSDFPGLHLENFLQDDLANTSLTVLKGKVIVEYVGEKNNHTLSEGDKLFLETGKFHNVHTISAEPSCYMYHYMNKTHEQFVANLTKFEEDLKKIAGEGQPLNFTVLETDNNQTKRYKNILNSRHISAGKQKHWMPMRFYFFLKRHVLTIMRGLRFMFGAFQSVLTQTPIDQCLNYTIPKYFYDGDVSE